MVLHAERDVVAWAEAEVEEELRHLVCHVVELFEGHHRTRAAHDDGRLVGIGRRVPPGNMDPKVPGYGALRCSRASASRT